MDGTEDPWDGTTRREPGGISLEQRAGPLRLDEGEVVDGARRD